MNGLGNDFVVLDARAGPLGLDGDDVRQIANRESGIGCDQLIVMAPSRGPGMDVHMRIWNFDGAEVESCGNATRCIADILMNENGRDTAIVDTAGGVLVCTRAGAEHITVDMGAPRFGWREIPLSEEFRDTRMIELQIGPIDAPVLHSPSVVNVGNPHCIFWVDDVEAYELERFGPMLEHHPLFPERANISLAHAASAQNLIVKVWERGVGLTRACGTAACAVAVCGARKRLTGREVAVTLPGGTLDLVWRESDDHMLMTGPFAYEYDGMLQEALGLSEAT